MSDPRLIGEYLREHSGLTRHQVVQGLREQVRAKDEGRARRIGEILVDMGFVSRQQVEAAAIRQSRAHRASDPEPSTVA